MNEKEADRKFMNRESFIMLESVFKSPPGIYGREDLYHFAVLLLLMEVEGELHVVFQERSSNVRQPGEICLPGGGFESKIDVTVEDTALRETFEEINLCRSDIDIIGRLDSVYTRMGSMIDVVIGITDRSFEYLAPNPKEVARVFTLPVDWFIQNTPEVHHVMLQVHSIRPHPKAGEREVLFPAKDLGLPETYHESWGNSLQPVIVWNTPEGVIWGITGGIMKDFVKHLKSV